MPSVDRPHSDPGLVGGQTNQEIDASSPSFAKPWRRMYGSTRAGRGSSLLPATTLLLPGLLLDRLLAEYLAGRHKTRDAG